VTSTIRLRGGGHDLSSGNAKDGGWEESAEGHGDERVTHDTTDKQTEGQPAGRIRNASADKPTDGDNGKAGDDATKSDEEETSSQPLGDGTDGEESWRLWHE
jgi:hypothetical protein